MPQTDSKQIDKRDLGYDFIRFIATMMIVIHHFVTTLHSNNLHVPHDLQLLVNRGGGDWLWWLWCSPVSFTIRSIALQTLY